MSASGLALNLIGSTAEVAVSAVTDFFALYYPLVETARVASQATAPRAVITDADADPVDVHNSSNAQGIQRWLRYWPVYTLLLFFESFAEWSVSWFPCYCYLKLWFVLWLVLPGYSGASQMFEQGLRPALEAHEASVDSTLSLLRPWLRGRLAQACKGVLQAGVTRIVPALSARGDATSAVASTVIRQAADNASRQLDEEQEVANSEAKKARMRSGAQKSPGKAKSKAKNSAIAKAKVKKEPEPEPEPRSEHKSAGGNRTPASDAECEQKDGMEVDGTGDDETEDDDDMEDGWQEVTDPSSGRIYFMHEQTQAVRWTRPEKGLGDWEKTLDPNSSKHYYYNPQLEQTTWARPLRLGTMPLELELVVSATQGAWQCVVHGAIPGECGGAGSRVANGVTFEVRRDYADFVTLHASSGVRCPLPPKPQDAEEDADKLVERLERWLLRELLRRQALTRNAQEAVRHFLGLDRTWNGAPGTSTLRDNSNERYLWPVCASKK